MEENNSKKSFLIICFILAIFWAGFIYFSTRPDGNLHVYFLNVGQGDAILIQTPSGDDILIDGGPDESVLSELGEVLPFWDREIELMILTHPDSDHVSGLVSVLERYKVDEVWLTGIVHHSSFYEKFLNLIEIKNVHSEIVMAGDEKIFYYNSSVEPIHESSLQVLFPFENLYGEEVKDVNATSVVCRLDYQGKSFLFTGDAPIETESEMMVGDSYLQADVLKTGHHGSRTSTNLDFLEAVNPEVAIISCGKDNRFNHPHSEVIESLELMNIEIRRTDLEGRIEIVVENGELLVE
ncbi:ComEC/Rec2 family competence protein [Patescibacteria group bacterium]